MKKAMAITLSLVFVVVLIGVAALFPKLRNNYNESIAKSSDFYIAESTSSEARDAFKENTSATTLGGEATTTQADIKPEPKLSVADFTVYDKNGDAVSLSDFVGTPIVVNFWATWCGYCVEELPYFNSVYEEYKNDVSFIMLDLADGFRETQSKAIKFAENRGYTFPIYFDIDYSATDAYSVSGIPMTLLIDKDGGLYRIHRGMMDEATLRGYVEAMLRR